MTRLAAAIVSACLIAPAHSAPPESIDPNSPAAQWFESLTDKHGVPCCALADCRATEARTRGGRVQALIDGQWVDVPPRRILDRMDNPMGRAVVCSAPSPAGPRILCFVRVTEV